MWDAQLSRTNAVKYLMELASKDDRPIHPAPHHPGPGTGEFERDKIDKMLKTHVIDPAQTKRAAPIVLASNKNGSLNFCIYFQKPDAVTVRDWYPFQTMDECFGSLGNDRLFSTLDAISGHLQI